LAGDKDRSLRVWDVRQSAAKPTLTLPLVHEYLNLAWSPDGLTVAMGSANLDSSDDAAKV
jgi:WD40 repeat protein